MRLYFFVLLLACIFFTSSQVLADTFFLGKTYISLEDVAKRLRCKAQINKASKSAALTKPSVQLKFNVHRNEFYFNNTKIYLGHPVAWHKNRLWITRSDFDDSLLPLITPNVLPKRAKVTHIIIDPGHGGQDQGTQNAQLHLLEKQLTLDLAARLGRALRKMGFKVSFTRKSDQYIELYERSAISNKNKADLFISLHFNAVATKKEEIWGIETYILPPQHQSSTGRSTINDKDKLAYNGNKCNRWNIILGNCLQSNLISFLKVPDRGLKKARFAVLRDLNCPGALIECGFLSHTQEAKSIKTPHYRDKIAQAIAKGIYQYQELMNKK